MKKDSKYNLFCIHDVFYTHIDIYGYSTIDLICIVFPSNLHLHSHDISFVKIFDSFTPAIMLNTLRFKSSVLFGTHILSDKSLRVLQLQIHLPNLTANGS